MSGSPGLSGSARPVTAAQKSAEGIVAGSPAKARTTDKVSRTATLMRTRRQNIQLELALEPVAKGEARTAHAEPERPETPSNRRVRTRTHGGVGGEEPRGSPLSRLRYGPAVDSAPRLRLKASGMAERNLSARPHGPPPPFLAFKDSWIGPYHQWAASPRLERTLGRSEGCLFKRERGELRPGGSSLHKRAILQRPATRTWARTRPVRLKKSSALPTPAHPPVRSTLGDDVLPGLPLAFLGGFVRPGQGPRPHFSKRERVHW